MIGDVRAFYAVLGVDLHDPAGPWVMTRCFSPGHEPDRNQSCGVNLEHGGFRCHACGESGSAYNAAVLLGRSPRDAAELCKRHGLGRWDDAEGGGGATPSRRGYTLFDAAVFEHAAPGPTARDPFDPGSPPPRVPGQIPLFVGAAWWGWRR